MKQELFFLGINKFPQTKIPYIVKSWLNIFDTVSPEGFYSDE